LFNHVFTARELVEKGISQRDYDAAKTDVESFGYIAGNLHLQPKEILYIDDKPQNVGAAQEAGYRVILYTKEMTMHESNTKLFEGLKNYGL
jgi:HAD superfamily hydrolase (TIGR01509 family)